MKPTTTVLVLLIVFLLKETSSANLISNAFQTEVTLFAEEHQSASQDPRMISVTNQCLNCLEGASQPPTTAIV